MLILILFSFLAGIVTILSPCILPILPIVLTGSLGGGKKRPVGIIMGFVLSFTILTLILSVIVRATGLSADALRIFAVIVIGFFGLSMLIPKTQQIMEAMFSKLSGLMPKSLSNKSGFWGGIAIGLSLGVLWTPCVGPILASVIALAATNTVTLGTVLIMLAYSIGTAIPMFFILIGGRKLLTEHPFLQKRSELIQKVFGVIMILTAAAIALGLDRQFQLFVLSKFPQYGNGLTVFETQPTVKSQLDNLKDGRTKKPNVLKELLTPDLGPASDFTGGTNWHNSKPLNIADLKGKVVLVDFWTYTCINCIRTLPYVTGWYEKYKDQGLVVIGVHTPEFEFEKNPDNVQKALEQFKINYPVVQDNDYAIWNAYNNQYWPAKYFIDANGHIRKTHFGEGDYVDSEKFIQQLLSEISDNVTSDTLDITETKIQARSSETYLGYKRLDSFSSPETVVHSTTSIYTIPTFMPENTMAYGGSWNVGDEYAAPQQGSELDYSFNAKNVYLVMKPKTKGVFGKVTVFLDEKPIATSDAGSSVHDGTIAIDLDQLYTIVNLPKAGKHRLKLKFEDNNVLVFAFTFG